MVNQESHTSAESQLSEAGLVRTAIDALQRRYSEARETADKTAQRLGYEFAKNPQGKYADKIEALRIQDAVASTISEDLLVIRGFVSGLYVAPPSEGFKDPHDEND